MEVSFAQSIWDEIDKLLLMIGKERKSVEKRRQIKGRGGGGRVLLGEGAF